MGGDGSDLLGHCLSPVAQVVGQFMGTFGDATAQAKDAAANIVHVLPAHAREKVDQVREGLVSLPSHFSAITERSPSLKTAASKDKQLVEAPEAPQKRYCLRCCFRLGRTRGA